MKLVVNRIVCGLKRFGILSLGMLSALAVANAQTGPDVPSGFIPGSISIFAGGGVDTTLPNPATESQLSGLGPLAVDAQGNAYFTAPDAITASGEAVFVVYSGAKPVPALLAAVTTQASPSLTPVAGNIYQVTGTESPTAGPYGIGGAAVQAAFSTYVASLSFDHSGNLYVGDQINQVILSIDHSTTIMNVVAGQLGVASSGTEIGDGGPATNATLNYPTDARVDSAGNIYITDAADVVIRVVYGGVSEPAILSAQGVAPGSLTAGFIYTVAGQVGNYCPGAGACGTNLPATGATFGYPFSATVDAQGNLYIADYSAETVRVVYASSAVVPPILASQGWTSSTLTLGNIYTVAGTEFTACSAAPCGDGGVALNAQFNSPYYLSLDATGNIYIDDYADNTIRKIDASGYISVIAGTETPGEMPPLGPTSGAATSVFFNQPYNFGFDPQNNLYVSDLGNSLIWQALPLKPQTVSFAALPAVTYGVGPIALHATASSGLPVSFAVTSGPGTISGSNLIVNGAGTVDVTATQAGNTAYAAAAPVTQPLSVNAASLTVTADNASKTYGAVTPPLTASYSGFVNGDDAAKALTGTPNITTTATTTSNVGTYPITITQGTLAAKNSEYAFTFVNGSLTVTGTTAQSITFPPLAGVVYGQVATVPLLATASSGLPVQYTITAGTAATVVGSTLKILGAGTVIVTANQLGNNTYLAATPVPQTLTISPAMLSVTGPAVSLPVGSTINPATFPAAVITGFVGADTAAVVTGSPAYSTTATTTSPAGSYPIATSLGSLALIPAVAANYAFGTFNPGTLTLNLNPQTITFIQLSNSTYGQTLTVQATANSGLPVTISVTGAPAIFGGVNSRSITTNPSIGANSGLLNLQGVGTLTVTAIQSGNGYYAAAPPAAQTISVGQAPLDFNGVPASREFGAANPTFTYQFNNTPGAPGNLLNGDTDSPSVISGTPVLTTAADPSSAPGTYPIVISQGTLTAPNYYFVFNNANLTVLPAGSYSINFNPASLTIPSGQSRQTTVVISSQNLYEGTVTLGCGQLPANVTCIFSPSSFIFTGANNASGGANTAQGTLTINTVGGATVVGAIPGRTTSILPASLSLLSGLAAGLLIMVNRRRFSRRNNVWGASLLFLLAIGALGLSSCGSSSGSSMGGNAAPGSASIVINGTGTTVAGSGSVTASATLNVTIE